MSHPLGSRLTVEGTRSRQGPANGDPERAPQWNSGNSLVTLAPRVVVPNDRNTWTNTALRWCGG